MLQTLRAMQTRTNTLSELQIEVRRITPEIAAQLLEGMPLNRRISERHVASLVRSMKSGAWKEDAGDPVRLNTEGQLIDGQHRMWAVIESGCSFSFVVISGIDSSTQMIMDTGRSRTLADLLRMRGEASPRELAGIISFCAGWLEEGMVQGNGQRHTTPTIPEGIALLEAHPGLREHLLAGRSVAVKIKGGAARWGILHYALFAINEDDAELFFELIKTGENLTSGSPILALRRRLLDDAVSQSKLRAREYTALVFKAWNAYREGRDVKVLSWKPGGATQEKYPTPV